MSKGPGIYCDICKKARDLLFSGYNSEHKFTLTSYSRTDIEQVTLTSSENGELFVAEVNTQLKHKNVTADIKVDTGFNLFTKIIVDEPAPGLKTILNFTIPEQRSGKVEFQYLRDHVGISAGVGLAANPIASLAGVIGTKVIALRTDISYDTKACEFTKVNVGLNFTKDLLEASINLNKMGNVLNASYFYVVIPSTKTAVGFDITQVFSANKTTITLGGQHALNPLTTIKARFNNFESVSTLIQQEWWPKSFFTISAEVDTKAPLKCPKVGVAVVLKP